MKKFTEDQSFVCRLPYPLNIHVLIDIEKNGNST